MLNYRLLCRDADGNLIASQDVQAATDANATESAFDLIRGNIYELWQDTKRIAVIEANDVRMIDPSPAPQRRPDKLHRWSQAVRGAHAV